MGGSTDIDTEGAIEQMLEGLQGPARAGRARLLRELLAAGRDLAELRLAIEQDRLAVLPLEAEVRSNARYTARELAAACGLPLERVLTFNRRLGLPAVDPDAPAFDDSMRDAASVAGLAIEFGISPAALDELLAVVGRHMWQLAADILVIIGDDLARAGDTEYELAQRYAEAARAMVPAGMPLVDAAFTAHLRDRMRDIFVSPQEAEHGALVAVADVAVAFVDVVGFTELGERVGAGGLQSLAARLLHLAVEVVELPVRVVKSVGDALLLMSRDTAALVATLAELAAVMNADETLPALHVGIACGDAHVGGSDVYGSPVNLASRITDLAAPGQIWATQAVAARTPHQRWTTVGSASIKGMAEPIELHELATGEPTEL